MFGDGKSLNDYTLQELQNIDNFNNDALFDSIIIVPMEEIHDSEFRCMKGILVYHGEIVGSVGGWSDVIFPNGIGNYGKFGNDFSEIVSSGRVPYMGLSIDCLDKSHCLRIMLAGLWKMDDFIGSDMTFYQQKGAGDERFDR